MAARADYTSFTHSIAHLLGLGRRWPPAQLRGTFNRLRLQTATRADSLPWDAAMRALVDELLDASTNEAPVHDRLTIASAAISMMVHLVPSRSKGETRLVNDRRRRTVYGSYPTPPWVASAAAQHIAAHLRQSGDALTVLDPTIEGAPLLLECARVLAHRPDIRLIGIDREAAAIAACEQLFLKAAVLAPAAYLLPTLLNVNSLVAMQEMAPIDALVNNPPWGERTRNGADAFTGTADPYEHFVQRGITLLREGGPFALVLPGQAATAPTAAGLRALLTEHCTLDSVTTLPSHCFPRATVRSILVLGRKQHPARYYPIVALVNYPAGPISKECAPPDIATAPQNSLGQGGAPWLTCASIEPPFRALGPTVPLGRLSEISSGIKPYGRGRGLPPQTPDIIAGAAYTYQSPEPGTTPVLRGKQVQAFRCTPPQEHVRLGRHLAHVGRYAQESGRPRVYVREICGRDGRITAAVAPLGTVPRYGLFSVEIQPGRLSPHALATLLNSALAARYVRSSCGGHFKESFNRIRVEDLRRLPIPVSLLNGGHYYTTLDDAGRRLHDEITAKERTRLLSEVENLLEEAYLAL